MKCEELLAILNEYVDGEIDPGVCEEYREHLDNCDPCQVVVDNIRKTIELCRACEPFELRPAFKTKLDAALRERWRTRRDCRQR
ncbi:MAG: zf-HC2 domain-containing protein [Candidatus Wallbacteria bacterium]|nr:zf-HC2 domain-containing protein [Candidatus Wallbacteria bacterium]